MSTTTTPTTRQWANKVPLVTATFWVIKILSTTIGETFADYLAVNVGLGPAVTDGIMMTALVVLLTIQLRTRRYTPVAYWTTVVLVSIVGTQITDFFTDTLGVSLYASTAVFAVLLAVVFSVWYRQEHTLSIRSIDTPRREGFYWGAILTTFALGTAAGDLATEALGLGFRNGVLLFSALILACWIAYRLGAGVVAMFWAAYILTRPLGASIGDLLTQDRAYGGVGLGAQATSLLFFAVIVVLVAREQLLATRHGVAVKGDGPLGGRTADIGWALAGALAVAVTAGVATSGSDTTTTAAPDVAASAAGTAHAATTGAASGAASGAAAHTSGPLGDLTPFAVIVDDVTTKVKAGDLAGGKTRVKDLEVAWDDAEAGLKPRSSSDWHTMDDAIDGLLTALRADSPTQPACLSAATNLQNVIAGLLRVRRGVRRPRPAGRRRDAARSSP